MLTSMLTYDIVWRTVRNLQAFDTGMPTPALVKLINEGSIPNGRAFVPGCGRGHDVFALASPDRHVVGLDLVEEGIRQGTQVNSDRPTEILWLRKASL